MDTDAVVFMDTETLGLDKKAPIWEFAAVRRDADGTEEHYHWFIEHSPWKHPGRLWAREMPEEFAKDYAERYNAEDAIHMGDLVCKVLPHIYRGRAHSIGAVPNFDTERLEAQCVKYGKDAPWHYHLIDVENIVVGYLAGRGQYVPRPWKSDELSRLVGVDPEQFRRHSAMGDVEWEMAQWDAVMEADIPEWQAGVKDILSDVYWALQELRARRLKPSDIPHELHDLWHGYWA